MSEGFFDSSFRRLMGVLWVLLLLVTVEVYESFRVGAAPGISRTGVLLAQGAGCDDGDRGAEDAKRRLYSEDDLKLKGSPAFDVIVPKGINLSLTPAEQKMIDMKEEAERAAAEAAAKSGEEEGKKMSDAEILKAEMAAMLERIRKETE